jgi:glycosyltransferase involved in cell wall biosynthesis
MGLVATVKLGVDQAKGSYIAFCESDDYWHPLALELQHKHLCSHPEVAISYSGYELIGDSSLFRRYENCRQKIRTSMSETHSVSDLKNLFRQGNMIATFSCVMVRRNVLLSCNFETPVPAYLDWWLWWQIVERGELVIFFDMPLTYWRAHGESFYEKETPQVSAHNRDLLIQAAYKTFVENIPK